MVLSGGWTGRNFRAVDVDNRREIFGARILFPHPYVVRLVASRRLSTTAAMNGALKKRLA
jgi:hypothetical protein